jgi:Tfp pilus assembly protein PilN
MGDVNFIPAARRVRKRRRRRLVLWAAVCLVYGGLLTVCSVAKCCFCPGENRDVADLLAQTTQRIDTDNETMTAIRRQLSEVAAAMQTAHAMKQQPDWSRLLVGLSEQLGENVVLSRCQLETFGDDDQPLADGEASTVASKSLGALLTERRYKLRLTGFGKRQEDVSQFVLRLEAAGVFERVHLASSSRQTFLDGQAVAFVVECRF